MGEFKFQVLNPLLHSELRLKIMVALDSLKSADFMYLCQITDSTRGNVSTQITSSASLRDWFAPPVQRAGARGRRGKQEVGLVSRMGRH